MKALALLLELLFPGIEIRLDPMPESRFRLLVWLVVLVICACFMLAALWIGGLPAMALAAGVVLCAGLGYGVSRI